MREVFFKLRIGAIEGAYRGISGDLVLLREASLPDRCIVCATPANGNIHRAKFEPLHDPAWHVPFFYDILYWVFGTRYIVDFSFCSICTSGNFDIQPVWFSKKVGVLRGASNTFMKLLPSVPPELSADLDGSWRQRALRSLLR